MKNIYDRLMESASESLVASISGYFSDLYVEASPVAAVIIEGWKKDMEEAKMPAFVKTFRDTSGDLSYEILFQYQPFIDEVLARQDKRPAWHGSQEKNKYAEFI